MDNLIQSYISKDKEDTASVVTTYYSDESTISTQTQSEEMVDEELTRLASLLQRLVRTDTSSISTSTQCNREFLNLIHFLQYATAHEGEGELQQLYSMFSESVLYYHPLASRPSMLEELLQSVGSVHQEGNRVSSTTSAATESPSTQERIRSPSYFRSLCLSSAFYSQSGKGAWNDQMRGLLNAVLSCPHCEFDTMIIRTAIRRHFVFTLLMLISVLTPSDSIQALLAAITITPSLSVASMLGHALVWSLRASALTRQSEEGVLLELLRRIVDVASTEKRKQGRPRKVTNMIGCPRIEKGEIACILLNTLREVIRELSNRDDTVLEVDDAVCEEMTNCVIVFWKENECLLSCSSLLPFCKLLLIVAFARCCDRIGVLQ